MLSSSSNGRYDGSAGVQHPTPSTTSLQAQRRTETRVQGQSQCPENMTSAPSRVDHSASGGSGSGDKQSGNVSCGPGQKSVHAVQGQLQIAEQHAQQLQPSHTQQMPQQQASAPHHLLPPRMQHEQKQQRQQVTPDQHLQQQLAPNTHHQPPPQARPPPPLRPPDLQHPCAWQVQPSWAHQQHQHQQLRNWWQQYERQYPMHRPASLPAPCSSHCAQTGGPGSTRFASTTPTGAPGHSGSAGPGCAQRGSGAAGPGRSLRTSAPGMSATGQGSGIGNGSSRYGSGRILHAQQRLST